MKVAHVSRGYVPPSGLKGLRSKMLRLRSSGSALEGLIRGCLVCQTFFSGL
jgi:hypothetical protein